MQKQEDKHDLSANSHNKTPKISVEIPKLWLILINTLSTKSILQFTHADTLIILTTREQINVNSPVNRHFIFDKNKYPPLLPLIRTTKVIYLALKSAVYLINTKTSTQPPTLMLKYCC